jgi:hypothetical protein
MMKSGLVIREPWIGKILSGEKTWEMRSTAVRKRERIALIRKGAGIVVGTAWLIDSRPPLTRENYMDYCDKHAIPVSMLDEVITNKWLHPWVLADARRLPRPVPYRHAGGVTFVTLEQSVLDAIAAQEVGTNAAENSRSLTPERPALVDRSPDGAEPLTKPPAITLRTLATSELVFEFRPEKAQAYGRPLAGKEFLVLKDSTAMRHGSPNVKRDEDDRDRLLRQGVLVPDIDPDRHRFARDHVFSSSSKAAGVIKDGNASGPSLWKEPSTGITLRDYLARHR